MWSLAEFAHSSMYRKCSVTLNNDLSVLGNLISSNPCAIDYIVCRIHCSLFLYAGFLSQRLSWVCPTAWPLTCGPWVVSWLSCTPAIRCSLVRTRWSNWPVSWRYSAFQTPRLWMRHSGESCFLVTNGAIESPVYETLFCLPCECYSLC